MLSDAMLSTDSVYLGVLIFADFADLPIRAAFADRPVVVPAGLAGADADAAGFTFDPINSDVIEVSEIEEGRDGQGNISITLHADPATSADLLTAIDNPDLYDGRRVKLWFVVYDAGGEAQGLRPPVVAYMTSPRVQASRDAMRIVMECEDWLAIAAAMPHSATYLDQPLFDAGDQSAAATLGMGQQAPLVPFSPPRDDPHFQVP